MPLTLFITGASGYIGTVLTSFAIQSGHTVYALSRTTTSDTHLDSLGAKPVRGDLSTHDILTREATCADVTINIADSIADSIAGRTGSITQEERYRVNEEAIAALARGIQGTEKKLVLTSGSLFTGADPAGRETDENAPAWKNSPLAPWVYGRGGSGVKLFMRVAQQTGQVGYVGEGTKRSTTVHVEDAARLYLLVVEKAPMGEIYNATAETSVTFRQLAEAMGQVMGMPAVSQPYEEVESKMGGFLAHFLCSENRASNAKATRELGWTIQAEKGILSEIVSGSYVQLAEELRKSAA